MTRVLLVGGVSEAMHRVLAAAGADTAADVAPDATAIRAADLVMCVDEDARTRLEQRCPEAAGKTAVQDAPARILARLRPEPTGRDTRRIAVVGYNLKFIAPFVANWRACESFRVIVDAWPKFRVHDEEATAAAIEGADVIVCEWCGPNAVIASRTKRPGQRLVIRLHRFELSEPEWREVDIAAVDTVVAVGEEYRRRILATTGWPADKVLVIPNAVDDLQFDRPKLPGARFRIGFVSPATSRKRLDVALDVLGMVRSRDPRFSLSVKGELPWGLKWVTDRPSETQFFSRVRDRIDDPELSGAVVFEPPGPDVAAWLRTIGWVLSTSDDESFHLAPAEGMASGAVPVVRAWPGADEIYASEWLHPDAAAMAARILEVGASEATWVETGRAAKRQVLDRYGFDSVAARWRALLSR